MVTGNVKPVMWIASIFQFVFSGLLTQILGMIRTLMTTNTVLMLNISYSASLLVFLTYCIEASNLDMLNGPYWYAQVFTFSETRPFNQMFEMFGVEDMNYFMNSASLPILFAVLFLQWTFVRLNLWLTVKLYRFSLCRKYGVSLQKQSNLI